MHVVPDESPRISHLMGQSLADFRIREVIEIFNKNEDGRRVSTFMLCLDPSVAEIMMENCVDSTFMGCQKTLVLTDGKIAFVLSDQSSIKYPDAEKQLVEARNVIRSSLSTAKLKILGA